ncbi:MAG: sugar ABC transporter ATP-binding protein [Blautia sp.]|nr:sugar ABC transporter ATP-binding protein [Blautia sp.]
MLEVKNITKEFPGVKALDDVSIQFHTGEIHALMGENGAGKSTLMKIITGIYKPDLGEILLDGKRIEIKNYKDSINYDISMVHQEIQVIPKATVAENIVLDKIEHFKKGLSVDWKKINETASEYLQMVELEVKPTDIIENMTAAQKQLIQIAKALSANAKYILLDEPTSSLTNYEAENLFRIVRKLKEQGCCIIFVSHKIEEVMDLCDCVSVLRDGRSMGTRRMSEITRQDMVKMMIGREENIHHMGFLDVKDEVVLEARHVGKAGMFDDMNLTLRKGEILGLYGLVGSGRTEFARLLAGADPMDTGEVFIGGKKAEIRSMVDAVYKYKLGYVTENRKEEGLILPFSVLDNMTLLTLSDLTNGVGKISEKKAREETEFMIDKFSIKTPEMETVIENLSGGNQQKVSIGKWLLAGCDILIIDEPTVGVDIGAKQQIHEIIWQLARDEGKSIILISSDMTEMITLARRIIVFKDFHINGEITGLNERVYEYGEVSSMLGAAMM